jgi:general secretion pathway protein F
MPVFAFKGLDARGKPASGARDADNPKSLRAALRREGIFLTEAREQMAKGGSKVVGGGGPRSALNREVDFKKYFERVRPLEVAMVTRQLATLLHAGIPLAESLGALVEQLDNEKLKRTLAGVRQKVNEGTSLADAMGEHPKIFSELFVNMVRAGEAAGNLDAVLARLADFMDGQVALTSKVQSALFYPAIMSVVAIIIISLLMIFAVPQIAQVFADSGQELPWNTQLLIFLSGLAQNYWWAILIVGAGGIWGLRRWLKTENGRKAKDRFVLRVPVAGTLVRMVGIARFSKTLGTMLTAGVPLLRALEIVKRIIGNATLEQVVEDARDAIKEGESIAAPLKRSGHFPPIVTHMIAVGERSGQLEQMLENVAHAYDREVEMKVGRLTTLLEPLMIVFMGGSVAFIVMSMLQPIMMMNQWVQ